MRSVVLLCGILAVLQHLETVQTGSDIVIALVSELACLACACVT